MANLIERHAEKIVGVLSCFDRLVLQGTLPSVAYPHALATELDRRDIRLFDYAKQFALPFREEIRAHRTSGGEERGEIEYIQRMKTFRKEDRIQQILATRGNRPGPDLLRSRVPARSFCVRNLGITTMLFIPERKTPFKSRH